MVYLRMVLLGLLALTISALGVAMAKRPGQPDDRERLDKLIAAGNFKDAYEAYRRLVLDPKTEPDRVGRDLTQAVRCLHGLGRLDEIDAFLEAAIAVHQANWRLLQSAAEIYAFSNEHYGAIVAGKFHRGERTNGRAAGSYERDRVRAIQLLMSGLDRARSDPDRPAAARYLSALARAFMGNRNQGDSWRLQSLTPLDVLPDFDDNPWAYYYMSRTGAPVEPDGSPVYYRVPASLQDAKNDGQRWRWALEEAGEAHPSLLSDSRITLARFLLDQFGTQTIAGQELFASSEERSGETSGAYALDTLKDDETITWLASGVKRFKLPDEFNPIKIFQAIADDPNGQRDVALNSLASIFENRLQLDRAADYLKRYVQIYGDKENNTKRHLDQIVGAWGQFDAVSTRPAGAGATVDFRFRNGRCVHFEAHEILFTKLLKDVKDYLTSGPRQLDWQKINISDIGSRLVELEPATVPGPVRRALGPRPGAAAPAFRPANHRHHAASKSRRLPAHRADGGGQHEPHRGLAR